MSKEQATKPKGFEPSETVVSEAWKKQYYQWVKDNDGTLPVPNDYDKNDAHVITSTIYKAGFEAGTKSKTEWRIKGLNKDHEVNKDFSQYMQGREDERLRVVETIKKELCEKTFDYPNERIYCFTSNHGIINITQLCSTCKKVDRVGGNKQ